MNIYMMKYLFFGFSAFLIAILILLKRWDEVARRWFYFSIFVTIWAIFYALEVDNRTSNEFALYASRIANACSAFIPAVWLYFVCGFLNIKRRAVFLIAWPIAWFLFLSVPTQLFIPAVSPMKNFAHISEPGPIFHLHTLNFFLVVFYGFYLTVKCYLNERSNDRKREIFFLFLATILGFIGGGSNYTLIYLRDNGIDLTFLLCTYPFLMAYAMIRHRVLDIERFADAFQREKLAAVGLLAASLHHELKSPLYVAQGSLESYLENVREGIYKNGEGEEASKKVIETSLRQLKRAGEIMQKLTDFAKPEVGNGHWERVPLEEVFQHVLELVNFQFDLNKIKLEQELEGNLTVFGNRRQFEEIFFNLITNACQAMTSGGKVILRATQRNGSVQIEIQDQGPGIPSDQIRRLFQPFYTTKETGTGLGLYITKQLVERNRGYISVKSKPNQGTQFILSFPTKVPTAGVEAIK